MNKREPVTPVSTLQTHKVRLEDRTCDPYRNSGGGIGWVECNANGNQKLQPNPVIEIEGNKYQCAFPSSIPKENLILPTGMGQRKTTEELINEIRISLLKVVHLKSDNDLAFLAVFIFATWIFDEPEAPLNYVAFTGQPGCGKSQALLASAHLAFNCFIGGGADSDSSIFRNIHSIRGTLALDEAQRSSQETGSNYHKILAMGNQPHGSISRSRSTNTRGDFITEVFSVFGPKLFSTRYVPGEDAILSRTYNIEMPYVPYRDLKVDEIDDVWKASAEKLRNDLLLHRQLRALGITHPPSLDYSMHKLAVGFSARDHQVFRWVLRECPTQGVLNSVLSGINSNKEKVAKGRVLQIEPQILLTAHGLVRMQKLLTKEIADELIKNGYSNIDSQRVARTLRSHGIEVRHSRDGARVESSASDIERALVRIGFTVEGSPASPSSRDMEDSDI